MNQIDLLTELEAARAGITLAEGVDLYMVEQAAGYDPVFVSVCDDLVALEQKEADGLYLDAAECQALGHVILAMLDLASVETQVQVIPTGAGPIHLVYCGSNSGNRGDWVLRTPGTPYFKCIKGSYHLEVLARLLLNKPSRQA